MAESSSPLERYQAIEQAYREGAWATVLEEAGGLLADLAGRQDSVAEGLRPRLQLLQAHTHLHGFGDRQAAMDAYGAVLAGPAEGSLRAMAQEGMERCRVPESLAEAREPADAAAVAPWLADAVPGSTPTTAAAPWLASGTAAAPSPASLPALVPEVVDEPELIEVHQADPDLAESLDLELAVPGGEAPWPHPLQAPAAAAAPGPAVAAPAGEVPLRTLPGEEGLAEGLLRVELG